MTSHSYVIFLGLGGQPGQVIVADTTHARGPDLIPNYWQENNGSWSLQQDTIDVQIGSFTITPCRQVNDPLLSVNV